MKRFAEETDWVSILKSIRELKLLVESTLTENQRMILEFSKGWTINTEENKNKIETELKENYQHF